MDDTTTACHRALSIYEIVWKILNDNYSPSGPTPSLLQPVDLARLARVCRALNDPTINVLWHTLFTLRPIWNFFAASSISLRKQHADSDVDEFLLQVSCRMSTISCIPHTYISNCTGDKGGTLEQLRSVASLHTLLSPYPWHLLL